MSTSQQKPRDNRKAKTSILFEIKQNTEQNIEVGQSMNIISLNNPLKYRMNGPDTICTNNKNQNSFSKTHIRRVNQSGKLTIKFGLQQGSGTNISNEEENNRAISLHNMGTTKKYWVNQLIDKFQRRNLIVVDRNRISTDVGAFNTICMEFMDKIDLLQLQNTELSQKIKKYESYFKQLKSKQPSQAYNPLPQSPLSQKQDRTSQLKILNLQRKIQTLTYIIKNYRTNNKEEIKQFEKKINQYKPTIENQLTDMLAEANKKYQDVQKIVQYFQKEYSKFCRDGNWVQLVLGLKDKDQCIEGLRETLAGLEVENKGLREVVEVGKGWRQELDQLNKEVMELNYENGQLKEQMQKLSEQKLIRQNQYYDIVQQKQELTFKYEALLPLQTRIRQKEQTIKKNSLTITRIQNENNVLKTKIGSLIKNFQTQFFNKESASIDTIEQCSTTIEELASRFLEEIDGMPEVSKELTSFITHLFDKTKTSFEKMIQEYRLQIQSVCMQNKQLKNHLNSMISLNQRKYECAQQLMKDIESIDCKRKRCEQSQCKIEVKQNCQSCLNWVLHWGQLNNLYKQMESLVYKLRQIQ